MDNSGFFQISADFELKSKPDWLDDFRSKYDLPYDYHITFKAKTHFRSEDIERLKAETKLMAARHQPITVDFDELSIAPTSKGWCIMIKARPNEGLLKFQKEISEIFSKYGEIISEERASYEKDFKPHITIARHLTDEQLEKAKSELKDDLTCNAIIKDLVLATVENDVSEQWSKPENRKFYKLGG